MITYIIIYLIGCILAYGRINGSFYEIEKKYEDVLGMNHANCLFIMPVVTFLTIIMIFCSWIGFLIGLIIYLVNTEKYFLKFKNWK